MYIAQSKLLPAIKAKGYDGVCYDWEMVGKGHSMEEFNRLMSQTKQLGLLNILTTTAEGPHQWDASPKDATGIDWDNIDYLAPQLYDPNGEMYPNWRTYADFWKGTDAIMSINNVTFIPPPSDKILWGVPPSQGPMVMARNGGAGYVEWCYTPKNV